mmetsp:Transcript_126533/g.354313  ORF Transcript_126533/g.354313 Transcript_126533/m.354313 type:complete len:84 (+) Transcript_126533:61-312(+)
MIQSEGKRFNLPPADFCDPSFASDGNKSTRGEETRYDGRKITQEEEESGGIISIQAKWVNQNTGGFICYSRQSYCGFLSWRAS